MTSGGREGQCRDFILESEMMKCNAPGEICKDSMTFLVDGKKKVSLRIQSNARDITAVGERERV